MITDFKSLDHDDNLSKAIALIIAGSQNDFALLNEGRVIGVLTQKDLLSRLQTHGEKGVVADVMQRSFATVEADEMLEGALRKLSHCQCHTLPVLRDGRLVGLLTLNNVGEFERIQEALERRRSITVLPN
jgi:predicted transcriptional regulator